MFREQMGFLRHKEFSLTLICVAICAIFFIFSLFLRINIYKDGINIQNIDANYHVLLTSDALSQQPLKNTLGLPLVSLTNNTEKYINWGGAIRDKDGNFYYTSLPQLSFLLPFLIYKALHVEGTLNNLMIIGFVLELISLVLLFILIRLISKDILNDTLFSRVIAGAVTIIYMFGYEVMFSQGIVYWGQSLMQPILIAEILVIYCLVKQKGAFYRNTLLFGVLSLAGALTEWTGYIFTICLCLFLLAQIVTGRLPKKFIYVVCAGIISLVLGLLLFVLPFIIKTSPEALIQALSGRLEARSVSNTYGVSIFDLPLKYLESFGTIIVPLLMVFVFLLMNRDARIHVLHLLKKYAWLIAVASFALIENLFLVQHAFEYSFDRLKLSIVISILLAFVLIVIARLQNRILIFITIFILCLSVPMGILQFVTSPRVKPVTSANETYNLIKHLNTDFSDASLFYTSSVRGRLNLAFQKNIYENITSMETYLSLCKKETCILLVGTTIKNAVNIINGAIIFDRNSQSLSLIYTDSFHLEKYPEIAKQIHVKEGVSPIHVWRGLNKKSLVLVNPLPS